MGWNWSCWVTPTDPVTLVMWLLRPRMRSDGGHLVFTSGNNRDIRFQALGSGRVKVGEEDLTQLLSQVSPSETTSVEDKSNLPPTVFRHLKVLYLSGPGLPEIQNLVVLLTSKKPLKEYHCSSCNVDLRAEVTGSRWSRWGLQLIETRLWSDKTRTGHFGFKSGLWSGGKKAALITWWDKTSPISEDQKKTQIQIRAGTSLRSLSTDKNSVTCSAPSCCFQVFPVGSVCLSQLIIIIISINLLSSSYL